MTSTILSNPINDIPPKVNLTWDITSYGEDGAR